MVIHFFYTFIIVERVICIVSNPYNYQKKKTEIDTSVVLVPHLMTPFQWVF